MNVTVVNNGVFP